MQYVQALNSERSGRPKTEVLEEVSTDPAVSVCVYVCVCVCMYACGRPCVHMLSYVVINLF